MKKLAIRITCKLEAEYFTSRLEKSQIAFKSFTFKNNETDTEYWIECQDIRISEFKYGMIYFEFLRNSIEPSTIVIDIKSVENFSIWNV